MKPTFRPPKQYHASYRRHRRELWTQILIPVVLAAVVLIVAPVTIWTAAFGGQGEVDRWAAISTMWLLIPIIFGTLVLLAVVLGIIYVTARLTGAIPQHSEQVQRVTGQIADGSQRVAEVVRRPVLAVRGLASAARSRFRRLAERKR